MGFWAIYGLGALAILVLMTGVWVASLRLKNTSIVDVFWGTGFVLLNWIYVSLAPGSASARKWLLSTLVTVWGLRLSLYILWRNWGKPEDFRYRNWRQEHGNRWWWYSYFQTFLLQGFLMWIISIPLLAAYLSNASLRLTVIDYVALVLWLIGFAFEAIGDLQLARFRASPENKGQVLNRGLWRYTRHPNYFGDATQWWAYYLFGAAAGGWWTIYSPILMTILLLRVSGVSLLEKTLKETKPHYREYVESTSAFVPWFPKQRR